MKNNSSAILDKITNRTLKVNTKRNFFIITAIMLTTFMITSVLAIGMSLYQTLYISNIRLQGELTHVAFTEPSYEQINTLSPLDYIEHIGISYPVGTAHYDEFILSMVYVNESNWEHFQTPAFTNIIGNYAKAENEIMLSRAKLIHMGIEDPYVGMEINLDFIPSGSTEVFSEVFVLSAFFTEFVSSNFGMFLSAYVSEAFAEKHGSLLYENMAVNIFFKDESQAINYSTRLQENLHIRDDQVFIIHPSLYQDSVSSVSPIIIVVSIIVFFLMFVGFLLIYNVMNISVSKDVRFYGLLKTLGVEPRQLKRIVNGQLLRMYIIGMPLGTLVAAAASFIVVPIFVNSITETVVSFSPLIYIGGALFSLITVLCGGFKSAQKASKVSPIESVRYIGEQNKVMHSWSSSSKGKPFKMAWRNVFRERKRALVVIISLCMGVSLFITVISIIFSMNTETAFSYDHDVVIAKSFHYYEMDDFGQIGMDLNFINLISEMQGVNEIRLDTLTLGRLIYSENFSNYVDWLVDNEHFIGDSHQEVAESLGIGIRGLDTEYILELNETLESPIDIEAFERGEIAFIDMGYYNLIIPEEILKENFPVGEVLDIVVGPENHHISVEIQGHIIARVLLNWESYMSDTVRIIMSNTYLENRFGPRSIMHLGINIEDSMAEQINYNIEELVRGEGMGMSSTYMSQLSLQETRFTMLVMGLSISGILALIGIFNFINTISVSLLVRRNEFAILESIGMSKKQMRSMLRWESLIYCIIVILASSTIGTLIAYGLFNLVHMQDSVLYPEFIFPLVPILLVFVAIALICLVVPMLIYRGISNMTLSERLREIE